MFIPMFSDVVFLRNTKKKKKMKNEKVSKKKIIFFYLVALSLSVGIVVI